MKHYTTTACCTVLEDVLPPPDHSKIMPVYSDHLFLIYSCVTVSEHHNFVKRELMKETQSPSPLKSSKGCTYKL